MRKLIAHISIILSIVFIVFMILDWFNAYMNFVGNPLSIKLLLLLCATSIWNSINVLVKGIDRRDKL